MPKDPDLSRSLLPCPSPDWSRSTRRRQTSGFDLPQTTHLQGSGTGLDARKAVIVTPVQRKHSHHLPSQDPEAAVRTTQ